MMYGELYKYFLQYKQLILPGVGVFRLERIPAVSDFPNRLIYPPAFSVELIQTDSSTPRHLLKWLAGAFGISERDAVIRFNDFVFELKRMVQNGETIDWAGVGILKGGPGGEIQFDPALNKTSVGSPVKAEKVIREIAEHTVRVGESERTAVQMMELLKQPFRARSHWWAWALVIGLLAIMFLGWYFSAHGLQTSSTGNSQKITPKEATPSYKSVP